MRFCQYPFTRLEVHDNGDCYFCCEAWLPKPIGNIHKNSLQEIWNSKTAQEIRASILDNSFRFCQKDHCEHLQKTTLPVSYQSEVEEFHFLEILDQKLLVLDHGPTHFSANFDKSCNLSCPTCRSEVFGQTMDQNPKLLEIHQKIFGLLPHLEHLKITGSGDPFASPYFSYLLKSIRTDDYPKLKILLQTNAQLLTPHRWNSLENIHRSFDTLDISIDAATSETYAINRRGGSFQKICENLAFIRELKAQKKIQNLYLSFVVQQNNWREMADFVRLATEHRADEIRFTRLKNWGTFEEKDFEARAVHLPNHPEHGLFLQELEKEVFRNPRVNLANMSQIVSPKVSAGSRETMQPESFFQ